MTWHMILHWLIWSRCRDSICLQLMIKMSHESCTASFNPTRDQWRASKSCISSSHNLQAWSITTSITQPAHSYYFFFRFFSRWVSLVIVCEMEMCWWNEEWWFYFCWCSCLLLCNKCSLDQWIILWLRWYSLCIPIHELTTILIGYSSICWTSCTN